MKKNIICLIALFTLAFGFTSCEKESAGKTAITYYAHLELEGNSIVGVNIGAEYVEPGYKATMNGQDVTSQVVVTNNIDTSKKGVYTVKYSITNADGFASNETRTVVVCDIKNPIEGLWDVDPKSFRIYDGGAPVLFKGAYQVLFWDNGDGTYEAEDLMAGWYCQRAGYGSDYAMLGIISIADDGTITLGESLVPGWEDSADALTDGKYDAATGTMTYKLFYAGVIEFDVTLYKVAL